MDKAVGVVIPFYQKEKGLLSNSLNSIFDQTMKEINFIIVIVDDESPVSACSELTNLTIPDNCKVELIEQKNAGPASARNRALDFLEGQDIQLVAFLDSDDLWMKHHIQSAITAMNVNNADFYFCDHSRFDSERSWFESLGLIDNWEQIVKKYKIDSNENLVSLSGDRCFSLFLNDYLSQTSSVVYNFQNNKKIRFDEELVSAGEDYFLWLEIVNKSSKVTFSLNKGLHCGKGVNIYYDSFDWSKLAASRLLGYELLLYKKILKSFNLSTDDKHLISAELLKRKQSYSYLTIKHFLTGKGLDTSLLIKVSKLSPVTALLVPFRFFLFLFKHKT